MQEIVWKLISAVILALVEGVTEFLPVSSTGHMLLVGDFLGLESNKVYLVVIQFAAILSICTIYFEYLWRVTKLMLFSGSAW